MPIQHRSRPQGPNRLLEQDFGVPMSPYDLYTCIHPPLEINDYVRPWRNTMSCTRERGSSINVDKYKYHVTLDVQHFSPDEIAVRTHNGYIEIEGCHDEKKDEHGYISRHFLRRYALPQGMAPEAVESQVSSDGVLTVTALRKAPELDKEARVVNISHTGPMMQEWNEDDHFESGYSDPYTIVTVTTAIPATPAMPAVHGMHAMPSMLTAHGMHAMPTAHGMHAMPMAHGMHAMPTAHGMHAMPTAHGMHAMPMAHGMHAMPTAHGMHAMPTAHGMHAMPTAHVMHAMSTAHGMHAMPTAHGMHAMSTAHGMHAMPTAHGMHAMPMMHAMHGVPPAPGMPLLPSHTHVTYQGVPKTMHNVTTLHEVAGVPGVPVEVKEGAPEAPGEQENPAEQKDPGEQEAPGEQVAPEAQAASEPAAEGVAEGAPPPATTEEQK